MEFQNLFKVSILSFQYMLLGLVRGKCLFGLSILLIVAVRVGLSLFVTYKNVLFALVFFVQLDS